MNGLRQPHSVWGGAGGLGGGGNGGGGHMPPRTRPGSAYGVYISYPVKSHAHVANSILFFHHIIMPRL